MLRLLLSVSTRRQWRVVAHTQALDCPQIGKERMPTPLFPFVIPRLPAQEHAGSTVHHLSSTFLWTRTCLTLLHSRFLCFFSPRLFLLFQRLKGWGCFARGLFSMHRSNVTMNPVAVALYRQCLGVVRGIKGPHAERRALDWWAEFLPSPFVLTPDARLQDVIRQCFDAPLTPNALTNAFVFLREARASLPSLEMLALWEEQQQCGYPFMDGLALQAAVLRTTATVLTSTSPVPSTTSGTPTSLPLRRVVDDTRTFLESAVDNTLRSLRHHHGGRDPPAHDVDTVKALVLLVHSITGYLRRSLYPEDFTLVSLETEKKASEEILNIFLFLLLEKMGLHVSLVGVDLSFRWVRVQPSTKASATLVFATWSYGAFNRDELGKYVRTQDSQWFTTKPWDATFRRTLLCSLLRKQLACPGVSMDGADQTDDEEAIKKRKQKVCKEQLLFLLT